MYLHHIAIFIFPMRPHERAYSDPDEISQDAVSFVLAGCLEGVHEKRKKEGPAVLVKKMRHRFKSDVLSRLQINQ